MVYTQNPFQLKNPESIISDPSGMPLRDFREEVPSSIYSSGDTKYNSTLVFWNVGVHQTC